MQEQTQDHYDPAESKAISAPGAVSDPVCGMTVSPNSPHKLPHGGENYGFCSARCLEKFRTDPEKFLGGPKAETPEISPVGGAVHIFPMHPQIVRDAAGSCPICGTALEPRTAAAEDEESAELKDISYKSAVERVTAELETKGLGVPTEIDVKATLNRRVFDPTTSTLESRQMHTRPKEQR